MKKFLGFLKNNIAAQIGLFGIIAMSAIAIFAPFIANGRPLLLFQNGILSSPALYFFFSPDTTEATIEKAFNYIGLILIIIPFFYLIKRKLLSKNAKFAKILFVIILIISAIPFLFLNKKLERQDWRIKTAELANNEFVIFAPIKYSPNENIATPFLKPNMEHYLGTDQIGRSVAARMVTGARISLAVGFAATAITMIIGIIVGMCAGYFGGKTDMLLMRIVEIIICFPTFLLLLILMAIMMDYNFKQSILIVILVIGLTGWTGLSRLVRGEVLKQRGMQYIQSCKVLAIPTWRIMLYHLFPNITAPIFVYFIFGVAGAILAESGLSFLGFGIQIPTASWGELLRQAFNDPFNYWHLMVAPGIMILFTVLCFNFTGEALRTYFDPKSKS